MAPKTQYLDDDGNPITAPEGMKLPHGYTLLSSKKDSTPKKLAKVSELKAKAETMKPIVPPKGYLLKPEASVSAYTPSVFEQLRNTVANSAVGYSLEQALPKVADALHLHPTEKMGTPQSEQHKNQLLSPEYLAPALTEAIRTGPLMQAPAPKEGRAPDATSNRIEGALRASGGLTTPGNMALMAVTGAAGTGVGEISPAVAKVLGRIASGGFTLQMLKGLYDQHKEYRKAVDAGDINEAQKIQGEMGVNGVMALLAGKHALTPHPTISSPIVTENYEQGAHPEYDAMARERGADGLTNMERAELKAQTDKSRPAEGFLPHTESEKEMIENSTGRSYDPVRDAGAFRRTYQVNPSKDVLTETRPPAQDSIENEKSPDTSTPSINNQPLQKPLHEMSPAEIEEEHENAKNRDKQDVIDIFGEEDAKKYNRLQKASNNPYDMKRADHASAELQEMESKLTPEQQNKLYGIGDTRHTLEDLKDYRDAYHGLDDSSPKALGNSLKWAVSQVGDPTRAPETMTPKERVRLAQLRYGYEDAVKNGYDPMEVMEAAVKSAAGRFSDPNDARMMLQDVVKALHIDEPKRPQLTGGDIDGNTGEMRNELVREASNGTAQEGYRGDNENLQRIPDVSGGNAEHEADGSIPGVVSGEAGEERGREEASRGSADTSGETEEGGPLFNRLYKSPVADPSDVEDVQQQLKYAKDILAKYTMPKTPSDLSTPEKREAWNEDREEWNRQYGYQEDHVKSLQGRLDFLNNQSVGELRQLPDKTKVVYLTRKGLDDLHQAFDSSYSPNFYINGASLHESDIPGILKKLNQSTHGRELKSLITQGLDDKGNVTVSLVPEKGQTLSEALATLREELGHTWQKRFEVAAKQHLPDEDFKKLNKSIPAPLSDYLKRNGYKSDDGSEISNNYRVLESAAKMIADNPKALGLSVDEWADYLFQYFESVEKTHGKEALDQLKHITTPARHVKEDYYNAKGIGSGKEADRGGVGGVQGGRQRRAEGTGSEEK